MKDRFKKSFSEVSDAAKWCRGVRTSSRLKCALLTLAFLAVLSMPALSQNKYENRRIDTVDLSFGTAVENPPSSAAWGASNGSGGESPAFGDAIEKLELSSPKEFVVHLTFNGPCLRRQHRFTRCNRHLR